MSRSGDRYRRKLMSPRLWLVLAMIVALWTAIPSRSAAQDDAGYAPARGHAAVIAQGVVAMPSGEVVWRTVRARAVGTYRLWRDAGFAVGAVVAGVLADAFGLRPAVGWVAALTAASGLLVAVRMPETLTGRRTALSRPPGARRARRSRSSGTR